MTENERKMTAIIASILAIAIAVIFPPTAFLLIPVGVMIRNWLNRQYYSNTPHEPKFIYVRCENCNMKNRIVMSRTEAAICGECKIVL